MAGNVWERIRSEYRAYPDDPDNGREDTSSPAGKSFTLRGGSWWSIETNVRYAARARYAPDLRTIDFDNGFRVLFFPRGSS
jgi:formylglycine-generating enzyme required for sulfatase activity